MPYITPEDKTHLEMLAHQAKRIIDIGKHCRTAGELNYTITRILHGYLLERGTKYQNFNDILGALEGAKLEIYRRLIAPYEDKKIQENGDVK